MIRTVVTDFKIGVLVLVVLVALKVTHHVRRRVRRRRRASFTVRENVPVGRNSWISFGHRFRE